MKAIITKNLSFIFPYILFIVFGIVLIAINTKADRHLEFNSFHSSFFDFFFFYLTHLGDGLVAVLITILLLVVKYRYAFVVGVSNLISSLITQLLKHTIFDDVVRPKKFFEGVHDIYFVPGVENYIHNSFPSGHTTCAFSMFFALALLIEHKAIKLCLFTLALLIGYSRIYLSQHFFEDVYVGSLIGVVTSLLVFYYVQKINKNWLEQSLITSFK